MVNVHHPNGTIPAALVQMSKAAASLWPDLAFSG
jgi:hypothetical protein